MSQPHKQASLRLPFGDDVDTLVLCINETHIRNVQEAFQLKARYQCFGDALMGHRFRRIIVFRPQYQSRLQAVIMQDYLNALRTKLELGGKIIIV
jgi:hypothetical protein